MEKVLELIKKERLFNREDVVAVACSGGRDSMTLLHLLYSHREDLDIEVVAINVDHGIRSNSSEDTQFVKEYCNDNRIRLYNFKIDSLKISKEQKISLEAAAREGRYGIFDTLIKKGMCDKIVLGHHMSDQVETIFENLFRGSGLLGAKGMQLVRDEIFVRPLLFSTRDEINAYIKEHSIDFVEDSTNADATYTRNFLRWEIMPALVERFKGLEKNMINFSNSAKEDNDYIESQIDYSGLIQQDDMIKIPIAYFNFVSSIRNRIVLYALRKMHKDNNIERKHVQIVNEFALQGHNGQHINLPNKIKVHKEYDYITITTNSTRKQSNAYLFKFGKLEILGYGLIKVNPSTLRLVKKGAHLVDIDQIPKDAKWRFRKTGDKIVPYGSKNSKKLKDYFTEKKVPLRLRDSVPLLASGDEIYVLADIEISDKIKITEETKNVCKITFKKDLI